MGNILDKAKKVVEGFKKLINKIIKIVKFFMTQLGMIVGILILVAVIVFLIVVLINTLQHAIGKWFKVDYPGISSEGDYNYLTSSLGYAGYDSLITEKVWQDYLAYEYAVLMDVAQFLYEGQEEYYGKQGATDTAYGPFSAEYYASKDGDRSGGEDKWEHEKLGYDVVGPAYMPYLPVKGEYDLSKMTFEEWQKSVLVGQPSARNGITNVGEIPSIAGAVISYGGNRDVMPPTLTYEFRMNPNEPKAKGSVVPYISVLKEAFTYYYYTVGGRGAFEGKNDKNSGVKIDESNIEFVDLVEINNDLNIFNGYLPDSNAISNYYMQNPSEDPRKSEDAWPVADGPFAQQLYFTNDYSSEIYKTPLSVIIDRYLPKATLLTCWYQIKDTDLAPEETQGRESVDEENKENKFNVDELMKDIKKIYNYYCLKDETLESEDIDAIVYRSGDGAVLREEGPGSPAVTEPSTQEVATTHNDTFIHFGQAGLETNKFGLFNKYEAKANSGPWAPESLTKDSTEGTIPVVTDLLSEDASFMDRFGLDSEYVFTYKYSYKTEPITITLSNYDSSAGGHKLIKIPDDCSHGIGGSGKVFFPSTLPCSCDSKYSQYNGYRILNGTSKVLDDGTKVFVVQQQTASPVMISKTVTIQDGVSKEATDTAIGNIVIPYEATSDVDPRGNNPIPVNIEINGGNIGEICTTILENVVKKAEETILVNHEVLSSKAGYTIEAQEKEFINYTYLYPDRTGPTQDGTGVAAEPPDHFDPYNKHILPFYNFELFKDGGGPDADTIKGWFKEEILIHAETLENSGEFLRMYEEFILSNALVADVGVRGNGDNPVPEPTKNLNDYKFEGIVSVDSLNIKGFATADQDPKYNHPKYTKVSEQSNKDGKNAIFDVDDYPFTLVIDIKQKRVASMIVTDVESWAKSAVYDIEIIQNMFDYTNYRYVVPHSYFGFGLRVFRIDEMPKYRVEYYQKYFSKYEDKEPGIKEADVLSMMMQWEEYAENGNNTSYAYMRDLYKLIMYIRQRGADQNKQEDYILTTAYTYLYIPDTIWGFREGISQEAFWTERLAAEMYGDDAMTQEELDTVKVRKNEIAWQVLNYDEYEECQYRVNGELKAKVYALFPFGAPYTRTWYMENALVEGKFDDGNYMDGHAGADWTSRSKMSAMLNGNAGLAQQIYDYELRSRTLRNIMTGIGTESTKVKKAEEFITTGKGGAAYQKAEADLRAELREYEIRSPEVAVAPGVVYKADYNCYSGFSVGLTHTRTPEGGESIEEAKTSYVHMRRWPEVQTGDIVGPGTILGYEGTTGRSGGNHLHQNIWVGGEKDSPSEYMAPIFAPFYNQKKILEILNAENKLTDDQEILLLGSDYYTLIRTVLMEKFEGGKAKYLGGEKLMPEGTIFLKVASLVKAQNPDGSEYEYINYKDPEVQYDDLGNPIGGASLLASGDKVIVKVGMDEPIYYLCSYVRKNVSGESVTDLDEEDDYYSGNEAETRLVVTHKEVIDIDESTFSSMIKIETDVDFDSVTQVIWGNNVPYSPIVEDMSDLVDISSLNVQKEFDATEYKNEFDEDPAAPGEGIEDIKATKVYFSAKDAANMLDLPEWMLLYMSDVISEWAVPFYEAQIYQDQSVTLGYPGSVSGDLLRLKEIFKDRGYDAEDQLTMDGIFDAATAAVLMNGVAPGMPDGTSLIASGVLGKENSGKAGHYDIEGVTNWNAFITFGSVANSKKVGRIAAEQGGRAAGINPLLAQAVASCESSFIPTNESHEFCSGANQISWVDTPAYPTETLSLDESKGTIEYRGVKKTIRRAQGLMQLAPTVGIGRARKYVGDDINLIVEYIRTPSKNALLGSEYLAENINAIRANDARYQTLQSNVENNPAFEAIRKKTGMNGVELALSACSAFMYNKGPGVSQGNTQSNTDIIIDAMKYVTYDPNDTASPVSYSNGGDYGYTAKVMNFMINNSVQQTRTY